MLYHYEYTQVNDSSLHIHQETLTKPTIPNKSNDYARKNAFKAFFSSEEKLTREHSQVSHRFSVESVSIMYVLMIYEYSEKSSCC